MNELERQQAVQNHYCSKCLGTRKFVVKGNVEECPVCGKQLQIVSKHA